jgi:putative hemolysin
MATTDSAIGSIPAGSAIPTAHDRPSSTDLSSATAAPISLTLGKYICSLATKDAEIDVIGRLRFQIFNAELGEGLAQSYVTGRDQDRFDQVCQHLFVMDSETKTVVGTYRMQSGAVAANHFGYYSQQEFDFTPYESLRPRLLELGRACIHRDHRNSEVLTLLWRAIALYCSRFGLRYLIGCSSLTSRDPREGWALYLQLQNFMSPPRFRTSVTPPYRLPIIDPDWSTQVKIPKLLKTYIATGARICSQPAWDQEFGTIDFLTLLDLEQLSPAARSRFLIHSI